MEAVLYLFNSIFFSKKISIQDLIQNQGLKHVAEKIFGYLDAKSLANCREVSKSWRDLIDDGKMWWILQLQEMMCGFLSNPNLNQNRIKIVEFILSQAEEHGFYLNATDNHGMILLHMACLEGNSDIVSILKKNAAIKGIDFNAVDNFGRSAFDYARMKGNADLIKVMQD